MKTTEARIVSLAKRLAAASVTLMEGLLDDDPEEAACAVANVADDVDEALALLRALDESDYIVDGLRQERDQDEEEDERLRELADERAGIEAELDEEGGFSVEEVLFEEVV